VFLGICVTQHISTSPPLPESLLASLFEVDVELLLSRELVDLSKVEIFPDSELDEEDEEASAASTSGGEAGRSSWFDGEPSPSIAFAVWLTRAMYLYSLNLKIHHGTR
jgi:hypothetical protein